MPNTWLVSIFKVGFTRPGFKTTRVRFPDLPKWELDALLIRSSRLGKVSEVVSMRWHVSEVVEEGQGTWRAAGEPKGGSTHHLLDETFTARGDQLPLQEAISTHCQHRVAEAASAHSASYTVHTAHNNCMLQSAPLVLKTAQGGTPRITHGALSTQQHCQSAHSTHQHCHTRCTQHTTSLSYTVYTPRNSCMLQSAPLAP